MSYTKELLENLKNICWEADFTDIQLPRQNNNKRLQILLRVIYVFNKYPWVIRSKTQKCESITEAFQKIVKESNRKSNKIWVEKGSGSMKS